MWRQRLSGGRIQIHTIIHHSSSEFDLSDQSSMLKRNASGAQASAASLHLKSDLGFDK